MRNYFFILTLSLSSVVVQLSQVGAQDIKFSHITSEQGLSVAGVNSIIKDHKGFMWFGTQEGINKYDGVNMTVYRHNPDDDNSLSNNFIYYLFEDGRTGNTGTGSIIWVCTNGGGLEKFDTKTGKFIHFRNDPENKNSLSSDRVRCIAKDKNGTYWVGTDEGLNYFDGTTNKFSRFYKEDTDQNSLGGNEIRSIHIDKKENVWIGTYGGGLSFFDTRTKKFTTYLDIGSDGELRSPGSNKVRIIYEDENEIMWIGTDGGGLVTFNLRTKKFLEFFKHDDADAGSISNDIISSIAED